MCFLSTPMLIIFSNCSANETYESSMTDFYFSSLFCFLSGPFYVLKVVKVVFV